MAFLRCGWQSEPTPWPNPSSYSKGPQDACQCSPAVWVSSRHKVRAVATTSPAHMTMSREERGGLFTCVLLTTRRTFLRRLKQTCPNCNSPCQSHGRGNGTTNRPGPINTHPLLPPHTHPTPAYCKGGWRGDKIQILWGKRKVWQKMDTGVGNQFLLLPSFIHSSFKKQHCEPEVSLCGGNTCSKLDSSPSGT